MRKIYLLASLILTGSALTAQQAPVTQKSKIVSISNQAVTLPASARGVEPANNSAAIIWSDDFSTPANWDFTEETGSGDNWQIDDIGPDGLYSIGPINSTSAANGFAYFDSDSMCSGDQIGNLTNATAINCTGHPNVNLKFQQFYRRYYDSTYVLVSNDGLSWDTYPLNQSLAVNGSTTNPNNVIINISATAGNQATVWVRFQFWSPASLAGAPGCGYAWEVDDVVLEDIPADDVGMVFSFPSKYANIPLSQVQPIPISAQVINVGGSPETNVGFNATVFNLSTASIVFGPTPSTTAASLPVGNTTAVLTAGNFTPTDTGVYAFVYTSFMDNADSDASNDSLVNFMIIDDSTYAKDNADIDGLISNYLGFQGATGKLANVYDVYQNGYGVTSVTFFLGNTEIGDDISASIHTVAGNIPTNTILGSTAVHTVTAGDTVNFVTLAFVPAVNVSIGKFAIALNQLDTNNVALALDNFIFTPATSYFKVGAGAWTTIEAGGFPGSFLLRPNLNLTTATVENQVSENILVYPNPANGKVYIHNGNAAADYTINILNSIGQNVYSQVHNSLVNTVIDFSNMSTGVYTLQMTSSEGVFTKSLVISNR
jgi:hypothetical protein